MKFTFYTVLKILGFLFLPVAIYGFVLCFRGFGDFATHDFMIGSMLSTFGVFVTVSCLAIGFSPQLRALHLRTAKQMQQMHKDTLTDLATTSAEITREAVTITAKAVRDTLQAAYCKHCGGAIDADSQFCKHCGGAQ